MNLISENLLLYSTLASAVYECIGKIRDATNLGTVDIQEQVASTHTSVIAHQLIKEGGGRYQILTDILFEKIKEAHWDAEKRFGRKSL